MNIYKITHESDFEFFWADSEEEATEKFKKKFPDCIIVKTEFVQKADTAIFFSTTDGYVFRM